MSDHDPKEPVGPGFEVTDEDAAAILERRGRFIRAAMTTLAGASILAACSGETKPCLSQGARDASPPDATAQACLSIAADTGVADSTSDAGPDASDAGTPLDAADDGIPQPCLTPPPDDAGSD